MAVDDRIIAPVAPPEKPSYARDIMGYHDQGLLTVLVIDDDPELREYVSGIVLAERHHVIARASAEAGLELLPYHVFDAAILDHRLPGMEGLVLGEYLHRNNPHMEVALMTGDPDPRLRQLAKAAGLVLLEKPFDMEEIERFIARAVERKLGRAEAHTPTVADPLQGGPIDLMPHFAALSEAFGAPSVPHRLEELLYRRVREALEAIRYGGGFDERARTIAYAGIITAKVLGVRMPRSRNGTSLAAWFDELMVESGRPPAFGDSE